MSILDRLFMRVTCAAQRGQRDQQGQGLAEYALILVLVALVCVGALQVLGGSITTALNNTAAGL